MCDDCAWSAALERITEAKELLEQITADAAADFVTSVTEKLDDMAEWITENSHVTERQEEAIENMIGGIEKWLH